MIANAFLNIVKEKYRAHMTNLFAIFIVIIFSILIYKAMGLVAGDLVKLSLLLAILFYLMIKSNKFTLRGKSFYTGFIIFLVGLSAFRISQVIYDNILHPHEWDFLSFYLFGKVGINGLNYYQPSNYFNMLSKITIPFTPDSEFLHGALVLQYFPPAIFYFLPLGLFDFGTANLIWLTVNILFLISDIYLVHKIFFNNGNFLSILSIAALFLLFPGTRSAFYVEQTTFIYMFLLLLIWKYRDMTMSGFWITIGLFVKPILAIILLYPIIRRKWKTIVVAAISAITILLFTFLIFGKSVFITFLMNNPNSHVPHTDYTEWINQSLLATILRITKYDFSYSTPLIHPLFIVSAFILFGISSWIIYKIKDTESEWAFSILICMALMIYPGTTTTYSPLMIPVLIFLFTERAKITFTKWLLPLLIILVYLIMLVNAFLSCLILWFALTLMIIYMNGSVKLALFNKKLNINY